MEESPTQERFLSEFARLSPEMPAESRHWFLAPPTGERGVRLFVYPSLLQAAIAVRYPLPMHERFRVGFLSNFGSPEEAERAGLDVRALEIGTRDFFWRWVPTEGRLLRYDDVVRARLAEAGGPAASWRFDRGLAPWELREGAAAPEDGGVRIAPGAAGSFLLELPPTESGTTRGVRVVLDGEPPARWSWLWECEDAAGDCFPGERRAAPGAPTLDLSNDLAWRMTTASVRVKFRAEGGPLRLAGIALEAAP